MGSSGDGLELELGVTEKAMIKQLARLEAKLAKTADKMERDFKSSTKSATDRFDKMNADIGKQFENMAARAGMAGKAMLAGIAAGAVTAALEQITTGLASTVKGIAEIGDQAQRAGVSAERFQEWKFVAEQNRIGIDQMTDGLKELNIRADEFADTGKGPGADAFRALGYGAAELKTRLKDPGDLLLDIIDRMERLDRASQIRVADEVFGGTAGERFAELVAQGDEGLRATIQKARDLGLVMDDEVIAKAAELDRKWQALTAQVSTFGKTLALGFAEGASSVITDIGRLKEAITPSTVSDTAVDLIGGDVQSVPKESLANLDELNRIQQRIVADAQAVAMSLTGVVDQLDAVGQTDAANTLDDIIDALQGLVDEAQAGGIEADALRTELKTATDQALTLLDGISSVDGVSLEAVRGEVNSLAGVIGRAIGLARTLAAAIPGASEGSDDALSYGPSTRGGKRRKSQLAPSSSVRPQLPSVNASFGAPASSGGGGGGGGGAGQTSDYARETQRISERIAALEGESAALLLVAAAGVGYADAVELARTEARLLAAAQKDGRKITPELRKEVHALALSYVEAGNAAEDAADKLKQIEDRAKAGRDAVVGLFHDVITGAKNGREALAGLLARMAEVQLQNALMGAVSSGGGGFLGFLGKLLIPTAAGGNTAKAGQPMLVNENTPRSEVFVPSQSGAVLNVSQAQSALRNSGGGTVTLRIEESAGFATRVKVLAEDVAVTRVKQAAPDIVNASVARVAEAQREPGF